MFLAEDRMLCFETLCRDNNVVKCLPDCHVSVTPIQHFTTMLRYRRSKINGQWYSLFYVLDLFGSKIMASQHSFWARAKMQFGIVFAYMNTLHYYLFLGVYLGFAWMIV
jgi:cellulose synthase/poly-beta-1,6-N-acetylglucosamine synthase-like glycosyltransferase